MWDKEIEEFDKELDKLTKSSEAVQSITGTVLNNNLNSWRMPKGNIGDLGVAANTATSLKISDGKDSYVLTPQIIKRIIEMVKNEFPEDEL